MGLPRESLSGHAPRRALGLLPGVRRALLAAVIGISGGLISLGVEPVEPVWAEDGDSSRLEQQLGTAKDFRIRVQAALELGKRKSTGARLALERALGDESSAVRAASAAALKSLGDPRALPSLRAAGNDRSEAVRNQVAAAVQALSVADSVSYIVGFGQVDGDRTVKGPAVGQTLERVARRRLSRLRGVHLKAGTERAAPSAPELMLDARVTRLDERRSGPTLEVSAKVDFVLSRMPGREIKGRLSGRATVHGDANAKNRARELQELQMQAVEAAADSALDNVERALRAAVE